MKHLLIHMVEELELCGLVHTHWMYPVAHYLKTLKRFVRNRARLEGNVVEGYVLQEALRFCTNYLQNFTATSRRVWDEIKNPCMNDEMFQGNGEAQLLTTNLRDMAHSFVLQNVDLMYE